MVSIQEARQQITQQRQTLQQQQQQIQETRREVEQTRLRSLTRAELQVRGREEIIKRKLASQRLEGLKKKQLAKLDPLETEIKKSRVEISKFEQRVKQAEVEQKRANQLKIAKEVFLDIRSAAALSDIPKEIQEKARIAVRDIKEGLGVRAFFEGVEQVKKELLPAEKIIGVDIKKRSVTIETEQKEIEIPKEDIKKGRPKQISLPEELPPLAPLEKFKEIKVVKNILGGIKRLAEDVVTTITIPEIAAREQRITSITLPTIVKGTQVTRPVDFTDIDTGRLPPKQNMELAFNKVVFDFNQGKITDAKGLERLEKIQDKFILDESKRTAGLRLAEGVGIGVLTMIAPPIGFTIIGLLGADAVFKRKEIWEFAKRNPKAAALQFSAGLIGGFVGAGGVRAAKIKSAEIQTPTLELKGKARTKFEKQVIENLDDSIRQETGTLIKNTATRTFIIDIPSPKGKVTLGILEYTKNNVKRFVGLEFLNGKLIPKQVIFGGTITKGLKGKVELITRSVRKNTKLGLSNIEISEFLERAVLKSQRKKGLRARTLTESEVRLSRQFGLRGLTPNQVREILRRPLFGLKEAQRKANKPFTENEFKLAKKLSKSQVLLSEEIVKLKFTKLSKQIAPLIGERRILDIRVKETGIGISYVLKLPKAKTISPTIKKLDGRVVVDVRDFTSIKITKLKPRKRIPLEKTFSGQSQKIAQILKSKVKASKKVSRLTSLQKKISPTGAFKAIAKRIQLERIKLAKKQATGEAVVTAEGTALKTRPQLVQKLKKLSKTKTKTGLATINPSLVAEAEKLALAGKLSLRQLQGLKLRLAKKQVVPVPRPTPPKLPPPIKIPPVIITPKEKEFIDEKLIKAVQKIGKKGVDVIVGMQLKKRKVIGKNLPKWKALKKAQRFVDENIEASYLLKKSGKKAKVKDIKPFTPSFKFKSSKTNPLFVIEKRKHRLDHPREVAQLQSFKGKIPKGFLPKIKKRRKKK